MNTIHLLKCHTVLKHPSQLRRVISVQTFLWLSRLSEVVVIVDDLIMEVDLWMNVMRANGIYC